MKNQIHDEPALEGVKFSTVEFTTISALLDFYGGNLTHAAARLGVNRTTLRRYVNENIDVIILKVNGQLRPYTKDRRTGHHKKGANHERVD